MIPSLNISKNFAYVLTFPAALLISLSLESAQQAIVQKRGTKANDYFSCLTYEIQESRSTSNDQETMYQANYEGVEESNKPAQTVRTLKRVAVISDSDDSDSDSDNDSDDDNGSESRIVQISPRKGTRTTCFSDNNSATVFNLMKRDTKIAKFIEEEKGKTANQQRLLAVHLDEAAIKQAPKKRLIQLENLGNILEQSPLRNYFVVLSYDLQTLYLYKWASIIASHNRCAPLNFTKKIESFQFFLNDSCILVTFEDRTSIICLLEDTQRKALIEQRKKENQRFLEEIRLLEELAPEARFAVPLMQSQQQAPTQSFTYPSSSHIVTPCKDFFWNPVTIATYTSTRNTPPSQTTSSGIQWGCMRKEEAIQLFTQQEYPETQLYGVNVLERENPPSITIHCTDTDVLVQINNHDIESYNILIGSPFIICLYTTDNICHVALIGEKTLIPIVSGITDIIRGPQNYIIVKESNSWFVLNINPSEPLRAPSQIQSPTPTSITSGTNTPALSATPSPSTPQRNLAATTNSNSPSIQRTETSTPKEPLCTVSGSTSSATASCAPSAQTSCLKHE